MSTLRHGARREGVVDRTYRAWQAMRRRCNQPSHPRFKHYGGRGVRVCKRWDDYLLFLADMGPRPPGASIDRRDVNGDYTPKNCRWLPQAAQQRNKQNTVYLNLFGERVSLMDASERFGIAHGTLRSRISDGWPHEDAVRLPLRRGRRVSA